MAHRLVGNCYYAITTAAITIVNTSGFVSRQREEKKEAKERENIVRTLAKNK